MTEAELQRAVEKLCDKYSLLFFHDRDSRKNPPGLPDLVIVGNVVLWVELKSATGTLKPEQRTWRYALEDAGQQYRLWRPSDLANGTIEETLRNL